MEVPCLPSVSRPVDDNTHAPPENHFGLNYLAFFFIFSSAASAGQVSHQKGIQCRFGARGIIAESHFDHGKNFVLMLRGRKRYLLNPPQACPSLGIIKEKAHPSFRHSEVDWSDEADWPEVSNKRDCCQVAQRSQIREMLVLLVWPHPQLGGLLA